MKELTGNKSEKDTSEPKSFLQRYWFVVFVLLYLVSPIDLISEGIVPFVGSIDDALLALAGLYDLWKKLER